MDILTNLPDVLTPTEAAKALRVGRTTMYRLLDKKQIKSFRIGQKILIPREYLQEFVAKSAERWYNMDSQMVGNPSRCEKGELT